MGHDLFQWMLSFSMPAAAAACALWGSVNLRRRNPTVARAALASAATLAVATVASSTSVWAEGGWMMTPIAMVGAYAVGSAVAAKTGNRGPRLAAWVTLGLTVALGWFARAQAMGELEAAVEHADPQTAAFILHAGSAEAWRPVEFAALLAALVGGLLVGSGGRPSLGSGERVEEMNAERRSEPRTRINERAIV